MTTLLFASVMALTSSQAFAQTPASASPSLAHSQDIPAMDIRLVTPAGHELSVSVAGYNYVEPDGLRISIHGPKVGAGYTGTLSLSRVRHWFAQASALARGGAATYDGWCSPFLIVPNSASPNGYALDMGDASTCSESGDSDWYVEGRALVGKDVIGRSWGVSPSAGLGIRHLSNGTTGIGGFRTDDYLYLPVGITARTEVAPGKPLSFAVEYDHLIHGWQTTRDSALGDGDVPATPTAPAFTINGFTDVSFDQHSGWAVRASAEYRAGKHWSVQPYFDHWNVSASPVSHETVTFTVNRVTASEQLGAYEPLNVTNEFGVTLGFHF